MISDTSNVDEFRIFILTIHHISEDRAPHKLRSTVILLLSAVILFFFFFFLVPMTLTLIAPYTHFLLLSLKSQINWGVHYWVPVFRIPAFAGNQKGRDPTRENRVSDFFRSGHSVPGFIFVLLVFQLHVYKCRLDKKTNQCIQKNF